MTWHAGEFHVFFMVGGGGGREALAFVRVSRISSLIIIDGAGSACAVTYLMYPKALYLPLVYSACFPLNGVA